MMEKQIKIRIYHQGAPIVNYGHIYQESENIVALVIDMKSKYCNVLAETDGDDWGPGIIIEADENSLHLLEGKSLDDCTHLIFPDYKDWTIWCSQISKYSFRVCLVKIKQ